MAPDKCTGRDYITSGAFITNPSGITSEPIITVYGSGDITLMVDTQIVLLTGVNGSITVDSVLKEAYKGTTLKNSSMTGEFPVLRPGANAISWSGSVTKVVIQPNWRYL